MYEEQLPTTLLELTWLLIAADTYDCPALSKEIQAAHQELLEEQAKLDRQQQQQKEEDEEEKEEVDDEGEHADDIAGEDQQQEKKGQGQEQQESKQQEQCKEKGHINLEVVQEVYLISQSYPHHIQRKHGILWSLVKACTHWVSILSLS